MKKPYLFIFTIGPVQSFIAQARKTRDLYAGSALLSELIKTAIGAVGADKVIFPYVQNAQGLEAAQSLPNRFVALVKLDEDACQGFGNEVELKVREEFYSKASKTLGDHAKPFGFDAQIAQHLQIHWVVQSLEQGYAKSFKTLEENLGIVKNLRPFSQYSYAEQLGERGRKCSLDGERNAVFFGEGTNPLYLNQWNPHAKLLPNALVAVNEGLSAVSFLKRFYKQNEDYFEQFPSTAKVALMESLRRVAPEVVAPFQKHFGLVAGKTITPKKGEKWASFDEQFFFEENLVSKQIPSTQQLANARIQHQKVVSEFGQKGVSFRKYYAVLLFDVDQMGSWLSGDRLQDAYKNEQLLNFHKAFSQLLLNYATKARQVLCPELHNGQVVYAGGDDFLGFINLTHLFEVVNELRELFLKEVSTPVQEQYAQSGKLLHFSAGIVIAHYKAPFAEVLKKARQMEKIAKEKGDRNAFAIATMKHSGEVQEVVFKWQQHQRDQTATCWQSIATVVRHLRRQNFSNKFIFNLSQELLQLAGLNAGEIDEPSPQALFTEMHRLIDRAAASDTTQNAKNKLIEALQTLYGASEDQKKLINNFIHSLHIADFIYRNSEKPTDDENKD
jgi:CRISPR-associated protein Cmr2